MLKLKDTTNDPEAERTEKISGTPQMLSIISEMCDAVVADSPMDAKEVLEKFGSTRVLVKDTTAFSRAGIIGQATVNNFRHMVGSLLHESTKEIKESQNAGDWRMVAWRGTEVEVHRKTKMLNPDFSPGERNPDMHQNSTRYIPGRVRDYKIRFEFVFADVTDGPWLDNFEDITGRKGAAIQRFVETGDHKRAPRRLQESWEVAEQLLREYVEFAALAKLDTKRHEDPGITAEQLEAIEQMRLGGFSEGLIAQGLGLTVLDLEKLAPPPLGEGPKVKK